MEKRGGKREGAGRKKVGNVRKTWTIPDDILEVKEAKGIQYIWDAVRYRIQNEKSMRATVKTYPTNATVFYGDKTISIDYDFQDPTFFESKEEVREWIDDQLTEIRDAENYDDIVLSLEIKLDKYRL